MSRFVCRCCGHRGEPAFPDAHSCAECWNGWERMLEVDGARQSAATEATQGDPGSGQAHSPAGVGATPTPAPNFAGPPAGSGLLWIRAAKLKGDSAGPVPAQAKSASEHPDHHVVFHPELRPIRGTAQRRDDK